MKKSYILGASVVALSLAATAAFAQSTGTETFENKKDVVIVKGTRAVNGLQKETGIKTKITIDQSVISRAAAGQTIADTLNSVPGYNFTNNDPYGSSGGNMIMRGMIGEKVSLTFDGAQLNDAGNYAIYTNQLLEPELICKASINTGATDIDSLTGSATGGTLNFSTCKPEDKMGGVVKLTGGDWGFHNAFIRLDSGKIGPWGTKMYFAYTDQKYNTWTNENTNPAAVLKALTPPITDIKDDDLSKKQYNFMVYQDLFDNGSFVSLSAHYNENRNVFYSAWSKSDFAKYGYNYNGSYVSSSGSVSGSNILSLNPSNTGNVRIKSKWVLNNKLTLTVDPTYQYTLANGGSNYFTLNEVGNGALCGTTYSTTCWVDVNKNGVKDTGTTALKIYNPNTTNTNRFSVTTSLIYALSENQKLRFGASYENARTKQVGDRTLLNADGSALNVFGAFDKDGLAIYTADNTKLERRDRLSNAKVTVFSGEYSGSFLEDKLFASLGIRYQKMERDLNQHCYSSVSGSGSSSPYCSSEKFTQTKVTPDGYVIGTLASQGSSLYIAPYSHDYTFNKTLANAGLTYKFTPDNQVYFDFSQSMASPKTDNYYALRIDTSGTNPTYKSSVAAPDPTTSNSFEIGYRHIGNKLYATADVFYAKDKNFLVSAYDSDLNLSIDTNVGNVERKGFEALVTYKVLDDLNLNASYTYTDATLEGNMAAGSTGGVVYYLPTKGKQLVESPKNMAAFGVTYDFASQLHFNLNGKYVGERYSTYVNDETAPEYVVWNGGIRYDFMPSRPGTYLQINVSNLFNNQYYGSINFKQNTALGVKATDGTTNISSSAPTYYAGAPRTFQVGIRTTF